MDMLNKGIPLLSFSFFLISFAGNSNSESSGEVSDTLSPESLVELRINSDIGSPHHFGDEVSNAGDSPGSFLFESLSMSDLMNVNGGIDGGLSQAFSLFFLSHPQNLIN